MKYYTFASIERDDIKKFRGYILKTDIHKKLAMFKFNDENYSDFFEKICLSNNECEKGFPALGKDKALYKLSTTGIEKIADKADRGLWLTWHIIKIESMTSRKSKAFIEKMLANTDSTAIRHGHTVTSFKKYVYVNKTEKVVIPYRLKTVKMPNRPLVIYHGGGGTGGCDNFKTLFEFFADAGGKKLTAANCNILIPQWTLIERTDTDDSIGVFANNCAELIKSLIANNNIDENRIYVYGVSAGAKTTWKALWKNPSLFTASVQAMGMVYNYEDADFNVIKDIPIWIAHSSNDISVPIDSADYCYEQLKALGADVKYTRWDKYGHKMSSKFFKQEPWSEWLLSKSKPKKQN